MRTLAKWISTCTYCIIPKITHESLTHLIVSCEGYNKHGWVERCLVKQGEGSVAGVAGETEE